MIASKPLDMIFLRRAISERLDPILPKNDFENQRLKITGTFLPSQAESILEIGSFDGRLTSTIQHRKGLVALDIVRDDFPKSLQISVPFVQGSIEALPFRENAFSCVVCTEVIEHLASEIYSASLKELEKAAESWIVLSVPYNELLEEGFMKCDHCHSAFHIWGHKRKFDDEALNNLFKSFSIKRKIRIGEKWRGSKVLTRLLASLGFSINEYSQECPKCTRKQNNKDVPWVVTILRKLNAFIRLMLFMFGIIQPSWIVILYTKIGN